MALRINDWIFEPDERVRFVDMTCGVDGCVCVVGTIHSIDDTDFSEYYSVECDTCRYLTWVPQFGALVPAAPDPPVIQSVE